MYPNASTLFLFIKICKPKENSVGVIQDKVQDLKSEYVWDWEDEFEDLDEAYSEQGRNQAEHTVLNDLINQHYMHLPIEIYHKLFQMLALHFDLEVNR